MAKQWNQEDWEKACEARGKAEEKLTAKGMSPRWAKVISSVIIAGLAAVCAWLSSCSPGAVMEWNHPDYGTVLVVGGKEIPVRNAK